MLALTNEQKAVVDSDPEAIEITFSFVLRRLRARFGGLPDSVVDVVRDWFHRFVVSCAGWWRPEKGRTWRSYLVQNVKYALKGRVQEFVVREMRRSDFYRARFVASYDDPTAADRAPKKTHRRGDRAVSVTPAELVEVDHPALRRVDPLERSVLLDRYSGASADEVGRKHGRNRDWCRRVETKALEKLGALK